MKIRKKKLTVKPKGKFLGNRETEAGILKTRRSGGFIPMKCVTVEVTKSPSLEA